MASQLNVVPLIAYYVRCQSQISMVVLCLCQTLLVWSYEEKAERTSRLTKIAKMTAFLKLRSLSARTHVLSVSQALCNALADCYIVSIIAGFRWLLTPFVLVRENLH